jgi:uncharacterized membrane protein
MSASPEFIVALVVMAAASFACRAGGFLLMRFVPITPRLEAAIGAVPLAVMIGIVAPVVAKGQPAELLGIAAVILAMKVIDNDLLAALAGVVVVAIARSAGM